MKTILIIAAFILVSVHSFGIGLFEQLNAYNPNWGKYESRLPFIEVAVCEDDKELIQLHLLHVLNVLSENATDHLSASQLKNRQQLISFLSDYRKNGLFPLNHYDRRPHSCFYR